jgi:hypothetical protein
MTGIPLAISLPLRDRKDHEKEHFCSFKKIPRRARMPQPAIKIPRFFQKIIS